MNEARVPLEDHQHQPHPGASTLLPAAAGWTLVVALAVAGYGAHVREHAKGSGLLLDPAILLIRNLDGRAAVQGLYLQAAHDRGARFTCNGNRSILHDAVATSFET